MAGEQSIQLINALAFAKGTQEPTNRDVLWVDDNIEGSIYTKLKIFNTSSGSWEIISRSNIQLLNDLKNVDGAGSGLDADTLQGYTPAQLMSSGGGGGSVPDLFTGQLLVGQGDTIGTAQTVGGIATIDTSGNLIYIPGTISHADLADIGTFTHAQIDNHINDTANPHGVTASQVGNTTAQWNANSIEGNLTNLGTLGSSEDGYAVVWDNATSRFITAPSGSNISNADLTWSGFTTQDLNGNVLTFSNGSFVIQGAGASTGTTLALYDNDTTPNKTWEWLDNGNVNVGNVSPVIELPASITFNFPASSAGEFTIDGSNGVTGASNVFVVKSVGTGNQFDINQSGEIQANKITGSKPIVILNSLATCGFDFNTSVTRLYSSTFLTGKSSSDGNGIRQVFTSSSEEMKWQQTNSNDYTHQIKSGTSSNIINFFRKGWGSSQGLIIGATSRVGTEDISLQGETAIQGAGTSTGTTLALYDNAGTPNKTVEFKDNGHFALNTTSDGFLMPRLTTAQMNAISTPDTHLLIFNTDLNGLYRYDGANWVGMSAGYGIISVNDASGVPTFYTDLQTAVTAAGDNGVVNIHSDITQATEVSIGSSILNLTINGNGYTITHTSDTGSEYTLFTGFGSNDELYINNLKIESNGTGASASSSTIFNQITKVYFDKTCYIHSINNPIAYLSGLYGGRLSSDNSYVNFAGACFDADITVKSGRGTFIRCDITVHTGGQIGLNGNLIGCTIIGDTISNTLIYHRPSTDIINCTITATSGTNSVIDVNSGTPTYAGPHIKGLKLYNYGTGIALNCTYIGSIKDIYIFSNGQGFFAQNTAQTGGYNMENVVIETASANNYAFAGNDAGDFRMKNVTAICLNPANTKEAIQKRVSGSARLFMEDCTANVNNPAVDNIILTNNNITTGGVFIYGLKMSEIGSGLNLNTVPLLNNNTLDSFGNVQIG